MTKADAVGNRCYGSGVVLFVSALGVFGCSDNQASKAWSALAYCVVGNAAQSPTPERVKQLRAIQLSNTGKADKTNAWPGRCATYANQLYAALDSSGNAAAFKRNLQSKLGCGSDKPSCVLNSETVVTLVGELWDGAKSSELKLEPAASVPKPEVAQAPLLTGADWRPLLKQSGQIVGPRQTADGRVQLLIKTPGARMRPVGCEFAAGFGSVECISASDKVPPLPPQSIQLVDDEKDFYAAGLTENGLAAFNMRSGEISEARGTTSNVLHEGLAVERGEGDKGFALYVLAKGKASKAIELPVKEPSVAPLSLGDRVAWVETEQGASSLVVKSVKGKKLVDQAAVKGPFNGAFHMCRHGELAALATWAGHSGQHGAKPNVAGTKTQFAISIFSKGAWSKAYEAQLPFQRVIESELVCTSSGASMVWVTNMEGSAQVGQLNCSAEGCKTSESNVPDLESRWWWAAGPVGDNVLLLWRAALGEARMRIAPISQLAQAKEQVLFDDQDHGGPKAGEAQSIYSNEGALLVFKEESPVALAVMADGTARLLTSK